MTHTEVLDIRVKACRPRFKAGSELSEKVNLITLNVNQNHHEDSDKECLDVDLKWQVEAKALECDREI